MTEHAGRRLRETLAAIMEHERLDVIDIMRAGGLARNSVEGVLRGKHAEPRRQTIGKLARGCATDPRTGVLDSTKMETYDALLNAAAGFGDLTARQAETMIELGLYYYLQDMPRARALAAFVEQVRELSLSEIQSLEPPR